MNHDATHCLDYDQYTCPKECYRAQLTQELRDIHYPYPVSFTDLKGTTMCLATLNELAEEAQGDY